MLPKAIRKLNKTRKTKRPKKGKIEESQKFYFPYEKRPTEEPKE